VAEARRAGLALAAVTGRPRASVSRAGAADLPVRPRLLPDRVTGSSGSDRGRPVPVHPNHCLHLDNGIILSRLPLGVRWKLSVAAAADTIYANPLQGVLASVLANAFPLAARRGRAQEPRAARDPGWTRATTSSSTRRASSRSVGPAAVQGGRRAHRGRGRDPIVPIS
jgi:hypothetical protein